MRNLFKLFFLGILGASAVVVFCMFWFKRGISASSYSYDGIPLSKFEVYLSEYKKKATAVELADKNWKPEKIYNTFSQPVISGQGGVIIDIGTGKTLFDESSGEKRPIASLTKIMTAVIALEHGNLDQEITVSEKAASIGENSMGLVAGETYTLEELLYGLILHSGNDAAYAIAEGVGGNSRMFTAWMNFKARDLGLKNTRYADPSGLDADNISTPIDLVKLTKYALKNPTFKKIAATTEKEIYSDEDSHYIYLFNQTNLLTTYPGVAGVKTGYTEEAGLCLVTYAVNEGHELIGVDLGSNDRKGDMVLMLDYAFGGLGIVVEHHLLDPVY